MSKERREFERFEHAIPLFWKVCKKSTIQKLMEGYTADISQSGLLCNIKEEVSQEDILWLSFDRDTLDFCESLEKRVLIYQNGVIGKVVRIEGKNGGYDVGIRFITREEKDLSHIHPKVFFMQVENKEIA